MQSSPQQPAQQSVEQMARLLGLTLPPEIVSSVIENFERLEAIAHPVLEFELPDDLESASTFSP